MTARGSSGAHTGCRARRDKPRREHSEMWGARTGFRALTAGTYKTQPSTPTKVGRVS